ncbi:transcriptional regulator, LacI family [Clostridium sp. USBA 49]|uniref:LacI family DNA-binding transcriptional regulator n=1 Tax=Clostridium sp. USBA 49 TaxID=1881060 RepID=UPI000999FC06|nr:LacI family DNA-binding transcriptional regulator [Clostridium sp. USBA 49]SKA87014.1 transcriptional regulator, LacI family [Clostridium sp. USBA 49]
MKKITMMDIAKRAGVSKTTVSMVLNKRDESISEETKNKILKLAEELNYIPNSLARGLTINKTSTIGIILPDITNPFFSYIARAIEDAASSFGYNVIFCNTDNKVEKELDYIKLLISKLVDGVIFISGGQSRSSIKLLKDNDIPFILVDRYIENFRDEYGVYSLNKEGVIEGIEYLYNKGNRKIVFVKGHENLQISNERLEGYKYAMKKHGIFDENLIFKGNFTIEGGIKATEQILQRVDKIDAIFYSNDIMALGGMKVLLRNNFKIPEDIRIMGFDNIVISEIFEPELTTVSQPIYDMGKKACELLINIINNIEIPSKQIYFKTELIIRKTT